MSYLKKIETKIKQNYTIWDIAMTKWVGIIFGLLIGAYYPEFIKSNFISFIIILVLIALKLVYKLTLKNAKQ